MGTTEGIANVIADCLSRDFHMNDIDLTQFLHYAIPSQMPMNFQIFHLPEELSSWIVSVVGSLPQSKELLPIPSPSNLALGKNGSTILTEDTSMTSSLTAIPLNIPTGSWSTLYTTSGKISMDLQRRINSQVELLDQQSRPSGRTYGLASYWTSKGRDNSLYSVN